MNRNGILALVQRRIRSVAAAFGLLTAVVVFTPLTVLWGGWLAHPWLDSKGDILIVLGGASVEDFLGENSYWRSLYAVRYYRAGGIKRIYLTGGPPERPVAESMRRFLLASGVPADVIRTETASESTRENALRLAPLLERDPGRPVLLTSDYHMWRARRVFQRAGIQVLPLPVPDVRKRGQTIRGRWGAFCDLLSESGKLIYYYSKGWI
jgi:uncharacterized SAM-binding protein YcdF (DUF218 family)